MTIAWRQCTGGKILYELFDIPAWFFSRIPSNEQKERGQKAFAKERKIVRWQSFASSFFPTSALPQPALYWVSICNLAQLTFLGLE
jgi:hypothetical protein